MWVLLTRATEGTDNLAPKMVLRYAHLSTDHLKSVASNGEEKFQHYREIKNRK